MATVTAASGASGAGVLRAASYLKQDLSDPEIDALVYDSVVWANQHGLVVALKDKEFVNPELAVVHAPISLLPVAYPRKRFEQAQALQLALNLLVDAVASDEEYLEQTLGPAAKYDEFTRKLLEVLVQTRSVRQKHADKQLSLGIHRSDYMLDQPSGRFLQVELNTIASSFGCLSALTAQLHAYTASRTALLDPSALPANNTLTELPAALAAAAAAVGPPGGVVVMVVQPGERNAYDQQWLQLRLWEAHGLRTLRLTLADIAQQAVLGPGGELTLPGVTPGAPRVPVSVVYFRAGYTPDDYPSDLEWQARVVIESSTAARCPTVAYQLAGAKKVQQDLARPGVLERFVVGEGAGQRCAEIREFFAGLWGLDDLSEPSTAQVVAQAIADPDSFVLKPQREGGGNNLYGEELRVRLQEGGPGLAAYILMQRIRPPPTTGVLVRNGAWGRAETLSELGIFGTFLARGGAGAGAHREVLLNKQAGHLVRTKHSNANEGGVAAGFAVLDSPYLV